MILNERFYAAFSPILPGRRHQTDADEEASSNDRHSSLDGSEAEVPQPHALSVEVFQLCTPLIA